MLLIRNAQLAALQADAERRFLEQLVELTARRCAGAAALAVDERRQRVAAYVERGRGHGLTWASSLGDFVGLCFELGEDFDRHPLVQNALVDPTTPVNERLSALCGRLTEEEWDAIRWVAHPRAAGGRGGP